MDEKKGILLESGTNEFELIEFIIGKTSYGINVAKVREVINGIAPTFIPQMHPFVKGVFSLRGKVIPLISLAKSLGLEESEAAQRIIVCELNNVFVGFLVDDVSRIHRISWTKMETPPAVGGSEVATGIVKMDDRMIILLDFERIVAEINPEIKRKLSEIPVANLESAASRGAKRLLIAEDSKMLRELLQHTLSAAGYTQLILKENGKEAWEYLESDIASAQQSGAIDLVITDIEMPQMDGHHFLKRIKEHPLLNALPVVIFSSLIHEEMRRKGEGLGASAQITKPEIAKLITILDQLLP